MSQPIFFQLFYDNDLPARLLELTGWEQGALSVHAFPDGESLIRVDTPVSGRPVIILANLQGPDGKYLQLAMLCDYLRQQGASGIHLLSPYLPYMRQDKAFNPGEAVSAQLFARRLGTVVDDLTTIDPHLHRIHDLSEVYRIPATTLHADPLIAQWIRNNLEKPLIIGPDSESRQWAQAVAEQVGCDHLVLEKIRHGDNDVEVSAPDAHRFTDHTPVMVDDIISTGHTMIETAQHLERLKLKAPVCIGVHGLFSGDAWRAMQNSYIADIVTCDTIPHPTNRISVAQLLADNSR
ncbi:ribose-phosphate pyrophosphokinase [Marinobacteraceae bacterium S3BR75-40.1]